MTAAHDLRAALGRALRRSAPWTCPAFEPQPLPPAWALRHGAGVARGRRLARALLRLRVLGRAARAFQRAGRPGLDDRARARARGARWRTLREVLAAVDRHERAASRAVDAIDHDRRPAAYGRAVRRWLRRRDRRRSVRRELLVALPLPLCPACCAAIGGAWGGPDAPWRPALPAERCAAQDHGGA